MAENKKAEEKKPEEPKAEEKKPEEKKPVEKPKVKVAIKPINQYFKKKNGSDSEPKQSLV